MATVLQEFAIYHSQTATFGFLDHVLEFLFSLKEHLHELMDSNLIEAVQCKQ